MVTTLLSIRDFEARALAEIKRQPGCSDIRNIAINRVTDERAGNNWSVCVCYLLALPTPTPRHALRSMSNALSATTTT
jgi:hypothetical protein